MDHLTIDSATDLLARGHIVAIPTETVYGLAADADNAAAVAQVYATKGRPADHPLIVHVASREHAAHFADASAPHFPRWACKLMAAFWPGPLTVIVPRRAGRGEAAAGGQASIGIRCPSHPVAQTLLDACLQLPQPIFGLAAPSANRFGRISPTTAAHVVDDFTGTVPVLDGGPCVVGLESTIVDCTRDVPIILRPGAIGAAQIAAVTGLQPLTAAQAAARVEQAAPRASGTLAAHYAPRAPLVVFDTLDELAALASRAAGTHTGAGSGSPAMAVYARGATLQAFAAFCGRLVLKSIWGEVGPLWADASNNAPHGLSQPEDDHAAAAALFADLRRLDAASPALIAVERRSQAAGHDAITVAIADRLGRAAAAAALPENNSAH